MKRVAIVTGAARGIGAAIAGRLEADGFTVARLDRRREVNEFRFDLGAVETHEAAIDAMSWRGLAALTASSTMPGSLRQSAAISWIWSRRHLTR